MKNVLKRCLSILLAIAIIFTSAYVGLNEVDFGGLFKLKAEAASHSGSCGEAVTWTLDTSTGELIISGTGDMRSYSSSSYYP